MRSFVFLILISLSWCSFAKAAPEKILIVGDSLSAAYGMHLSEGWVSLLKKRLASQSLDFIIINESLTGQTTAAGLAHLPTLLAKHQAQILILELGANDGLQGLPIAHIQQNLAQMIELAQKMPMRVLLIGMQLPPNYGTQYTQMFKNIFPTLATQYKIALAPFLLEGVGGYIQYVQQDNIHPTKEAQSIMLENVWPYLKPLLNSSSVQSTSPDMSILPSLQAQLRHCERSAAIQVVMSNLAPEPGLPRCARNDEAALAMMVL